METNKLAEFIKTYYEFETKKTVLDDMEVIIHDRHEHQRLPK